jgi:hypothetical protein
MRSDVRSFGEFSVLRYRFVDRSVYDRLGTLFVVRIWLENWGSRSKIFATTMVRLSPGERIETFLDGGCAFEFTC